MAQKENKSKGEKITDYFASSGQYAKTSSKKRARDHSLAMFVAEDMRPINLIEGRGFRKFASTLDPQYRIPTRKYVTKVIKVTAGAKREDVKKILKDIEWVAFTIDAWSSRRMVGFLAVTSHFINEDGYLNQVLLSCESMHERETGENIARRLHEVFDSYDVNSKITAGTTDSGSNVKKGLSVAGYVRISCFAHALNLVAHDAMRTNLAQVAQAMRDNRELTIEEMGMKGFDDVRRKVRKFVERLHRSRNAKAEFKKCQTRVGLPTNEIEQEVDTRWNSCYIMLKTFFMMKDAVVLFLTSPEGEDFMFQAAEWKIIEQALEVLEPLYLVTVEISGDTYVTGSKIIPLTKILLAHYVQMVRQSGDPDNFRHIFTNAVHQGLWNHLNAVEKVDELGIATLCDCRYKKVAFRDAEMASNAVNKLKSEMERVMAKTANESNPGPSAPKQRKTALWDKKKENPLWQILDKEVTRTQARASNDVSIAAEVSKYLMTPNQPRDSDPLEWWRCTGKYTFPNMWPVVRKYLAIPGSSVPSERVFSVAGAIISQRRARLNDDTAADLIMLRGNASRLPRGAEYE